MTLLAQPSEVVKLSGIRKNTDTGHINTHLIDAIQEEYIRPVLGLDLYDLIISEVDDCTITGKNEILWKDYIKPALSYYIWWKALPQMHLQTTNSGLQTNFTEFSTTVTDRQRADLADSILEVAESLVEKMVRYIEHEDNITDFPDYTISGNVTNSLSKTGGIIMPKG